MEIKIVASNFNEALDALFNKYDVTSSDIVDWDQSEDKFIFNVSKSLPEELALNSDVDDLIKTNKFDSSDIAFICDDNEIHTPNKPNLFERIKDLLSQGLIPIVGYSTYIDASNFHNDLNENISKGPIGFHNMLITKEGSKLKGTRFYELNSITRSEYPGIVIELDTVDNQSIYDTIVKVLSELNLSGFGDIQLEDRVKFKPKSDCPMHIFGLILATIQSIPGIKRFNIKFAEDDGLEIIGEFK